MEVPIGDYLPDQITRNNNATTNVKNVYPISTGWKPIKDFTAYSDALTARCQGAISLQNTSSTTFDFAGDVSKLYRLNLGTWGDVSRASGGVYATPADGWWEFAEFGNLVVGVNGIDAPQKFNIDSGALFEALGGSPPIAKYATVVRDFLVLGNLSTNAGLIQWSAFNNAEGWTAGTDQSDTQEFPEGGTVQALVGGEVLHVFQERAIKRGSYVGGDVIFQFDEISQNKGVAAPKSVAKVGNTIFFLGYDGFYKLEGDQVLPIGAERVDRTFLNDLNAGFIYRVAAGVDPINKLVFWSYPSAQSVDGTLDKVMVYSWALDKWSFAELGAEFIYSALSEGYTMETLDTLYSSLDDIPYSLDSRVWAGGSAVLALFDSNHKLGYLTGDNLAATLETGTIEPAPGKRAKITNTLPFIDGSAATVTLGAKERAADSFSYGSAAAMRSSGFCPSIKSGRYLTAKVDIAAGETWSECSGIELEMTGSGRI